MSTCREAVVATTLATTLAATLTLGACSTPDRTSTPSGPTDTRSTLTLPPGRGAPVPTQAGTEPSSSALPEVPADVVGELQRLLDARATAVLDHDRGRFVAGLAPRPGLVTAERRYFDNLVELPLSVLSYRLEPASLLRTGSAYWGVVEVSLQLTPYDARPTRTLDRFRFDPAGGGSYRVGSTTDRAWEAEHAGLQQPWDTEPVTVREGAGVLGVFDSADERESRGVVRSTQRGIADVSARVPFTEWGSQAVVYALSDPRFLDGFDDLPGGDPEALDGLAFTVPAGDDATASTRFALSPSLLRRAGARRPDADLDRLVRHELVHVAVGQHDDGAPLWLSEGIAEWVSWQAASPQDRRVPAEALAAVRRGVRTMPGDGSFNDDDATTHYALSWWVCEWLVQTYGPDAPWTVLEAFERRAGDDPRRVVRDLLKISVDQLARRGAALMRTTYAASATPRPSAGATATPGATGSAGATPAG